MGSGVKNEILGHLATSICLFRFLSAYYRSKKCRHENRAQRKKPKLNRITQFREILPKTIKIWRFGLVHPKTL